jgi:hypothetical protein
VWTQLGIHLPNELATQVQKEDIISVGDHLWDICAKEEKTPVESEQLLFAVGRNIIELESTSSNTLYEEETMPSYSKNH